MAVWLARNKRYPGHLAIATFYCAHRQLLSRALRTSKRDGGSFHHAEADVTSSSSSSGLPEFRLGVLGLGLGRTPSQGGAGEAVQLCQLLAALPCLGSLEQPDEEGRTPLTLASELDFLAGVGSLINVVKQRKDERSVAAYINARDGRGDAPLHVACRCGSLRATRALLVAGADVNAGNQHGSTPLTLACFHGQRVTAALLVAHGADVDKNDEDGETPLFLACQIGDLETVQMLLRSGANPDLPNKKGDTPLMMASHYGWTDVVLELIAKGADISAVNNVGYSAFVMARVEGHSNVQKVILAAAVKLIVG